MPEDEMTFAVLRQACDAAAKGGDAVDSVVDGLAVLEADPAFNAGYGAVLTSDGRVEVDAAVVDGGSGSYGAVGAAPGLAHPAAVAAAVLRAGGPVLLAGAGAAAFARSIGQDESDLRTEEQSLALRDFQSGVSASPFTGRAAPSTETVGCIVVRETTAAGSSTGGVCGKPAGRIGDSAILGAGLWADDTSAVVCSGAGEAMITLALARRTGERIARGESPQSAARWAVRLAAEERGAVAAVLAVNTSDLTVAAVHSGSSFPVVAGSQGGQWIVESERLEALGRVR